ncbi:hypothetical protein [Dokdonella koreensis]|uniref:OmpA/MotB domain protein n=1 Tax=Dokdonella koreensis DS-123 TaxID=1300342 RepID=A0A167GMF0_9GAMM|nr:hypothetical protein [Dokdonella koreensis]ANB16732.1 OmpA/MotB domain protein [Dokdonella koreensis DS-123]
MNDLERLRQILLDGDRRALDEARRRIEAAEQRQLTLAERLPQALEEVQHGPHGERFARVMAAPVAGALGTAVRSSRHLIIDALFPIIGPTIRKAVGEAMRSLVTDINRALESSFTLRGLAWRVEAWRSGVPYAEVVLKHTLAWQVDHLFLIERESGLVLDRASAPALPALDADAIAGMLTAIGDFVSDSVGREGGDTLESARVGEHLLWLIQGPRANLACFIRGVPGTGLHARLQERLERIHAALGADDADPALVASVSAENLDLKALTADAASEEPRRPTAWWPLLLIVLALVGVLAWFMLRDRGWETRVEALRGRLADHPGFVLTGIDAGDRPRLVVRGLLDPDADPLQPLLQPAIAAGAQPQLLVQGYLSTADAIVQRRAQRLLQPPPSVRIAVTDGVLALDGVAPEAWVEQARLRAPLVAGVRDLRLTVEASQRPEAIARAELEALVRELPELRGRFERGEAAAPESAAFVDALAERLRGIGQKAATAGVGIDLVAVGCNDATGADSTNAGLRGRRGEWLRDALIERGVPAALIRVADDADPQFRDRPLERSVFLHLDITSHP